MREFVAFLILCVILLVFAVIVTVEHRPQGYAMGMVTTGKDADANRLYSPCPLSPSNLPTHKEHEA
jgi:hypothetical protein